jgi:hypothetical protein
LVCNGLIYTNSNIHRFENYLIILFSPKILEYFILCSNYQEKSLHSATGDVPYSWNTTSGYMLYMFITQYTVLCGIGSLLNGIFILKLSVCLNTVSFIVIYATLLRFVVYIIIVF